MLISGFRVNHSWNQSLLLRQQDTLQQYKFAHPWNHQRICRALDKRLTMTYVMKWDRDLVVSLSIVLTVGSWDGNEAWHCFQDWPSKREIRFATTSIHKERLLLLLLFPKMLFFPKRKLSCALVSVDWQACATMIGWFGSDSQKNFTRWLPPKVTAMTEIWSTVMPNEPRWYIMHLRTSHVRQSHRLNCICFLKVKKDKRKTFYSRILILSGSLRDPKIAWTNEKRARLYKLTLI